jgi:DNA-binding response OmpR family regulator
MADSFPSTGLRVLVADDYRDAADTLRILLELWGHEVHVSRDGTATLRDASVFRPHAVLLDVMMPGLHGGEVARLLRRMPGLETILVVATSATDPDDPRLKGYRQYFDAYLIKPFNLDHLEALLTATLAKISS